MYIQIILLDMLPSSAHIDWWRLHVMMVHLLLLLLKIYSCHLSRSTIFFYKVELHTHIYFLRVTGKNGGGCGGGVRGKSGTWKQATWQDQHEQSVIFYDWFAVDLWTGVFFSSSDAAAAQNAKTPVYIEDSAYSTTFFWQCDQSSSGSIPAVMAMLASFKYASR